jgi:hypothetical protein
VCRERRACAGSGSCGVGFVRVCGWPEQEYEHAEREDAGEDEQAVADERVQGDRVGDARASVQAEHQHGHDAEGCGQEGEHELVHEPGQVAAVALIGEQPDVEPESPVLERAGDPVQSPR